MTKRRKQKGVLVTLVHQACRWSDNIAGKYFKKKLGRRRN